MEFEDAVIDQGHGTATPQFVSNQQNPTNYDLPGRGGVNEWEQNQNTGTPWSAKADIKLDNGQASLPLRIFDDGVVNNSGSGYKSISWKVTNDAAIGFTQETYIFSENNAGTTVNIPISLNSSIKSTNILIVDKAIQPIIGDNANNSLNGGDGDDRIFALGGDDYVDGGKGNDRLYGETGQDTLIGNSGNDFLYGEKGSDRLIGGVGDDKYFIDSTGDSITEDANAGVDTVESSISYTLGNNLENLTLRGSSDINGTGNALNNTITGNYGKGVLSGGLGNDTYIVSTGNSITEDANAGVDTVEALGSYTLSNNLENLTLTGAGGKGTGNALNNTITGSDNNDTLYGGLGSDTLVGQKGNDTYIIDSTQDSIIETNNDIFAGKDTVESSINYTLGDNLENLTLTGSSNINGTGNALNNTMTGNSGKNILAGGLGDDTYIIDSTQDSLIEDANAGVDTVESSISYTLGNNLENLRLEYSLDNRDINGTGNALNNTITGNNGKNVLSGGLGNDILDGSGNDTLIGGAGADTFKFVFSISEIDTIKDFSRSQGDKVEVSSSGFGVKKTEYNRFSYNNSTGALLFDQTQFATLQAGLNFVPNVDIVIV